MTDRAIICIPMQPHIVTIIIIIMTINDTMIWKRFHSLARQRNRKQRPSKPRADRSSVGFPGAPTVQPRGERENSPAEHLHNNIAITFIRNIIITITIITTHHSRIIYLHNTSYYYGLCRTRVYLQYYVTIIISVPTFMSLRNTLMTY